MNTASGVPSNRGTESSTFVFADLAGFTALTEAHGDEEAIEIAMRFTGRVRELLPEYRAEEVKTIGDEVMIRAVHPVQAVRLGMRIVDELAFHGSPPVRVGMHSGPATPLDGDWFGATVNVASRVVDAANPGEVLLTAETLDQLESRDGFEIAARGSRYFKHIVKPVPVYEALVPGGEAKRLEIDPVCRMAVAPSRAAAQRRRLGLEYFFCSSECARAFARDPRAYIATSQAARTARMGFLINLGAFLAIGAAHLVGLFAPDQGHPSIVISLLFAVWAVALVVHFRKVRTAL